MRRDSDPKLPNVRLKLTAPVVYGRIAFVNVKVWRRSLSAIRQAAVESLAGDTWAMFDATYFKDGLKKQVEQVGGNPVVKLILHSGQEFLVRDVVESRIGVVLLNVYPHDSPAGIVAASTSVYSGVPTAGYHPVAIAYESIANIYLSSTTAAQRPKVGFNL